VVFFDNHAGVGGPVRLKPTAILTMMPLRSNKPVIAFESIVRPYTFIPTRTIEGGVNGRPFCFPKGIEAKLDFSQYCAIVYSDYQGEL